MFVTVPCRSYMCLGRENVVHAKKEERGNKDEA